MGRSKYEKQTKKRKKCFENASNDPFTNKKRYRKEALRGGFPE